MDKRNFLFLSLLFLLISAISPIILRGQDDIDDKVQTFLDKYRWRDMNVPRTDGKALYDIIVNNGYTRALEIGTSTGHSSIWIAWALSKTGGKLITLEINESRHKTALRNFEEAGVMGYIDAHLGDAHVITSEIKGPFDFVFSDADKNWYINYAKNLLPKLTVGGCYTTHNVTQPNASSDFRRRGAGNSEYIEFLLSQPNLKTTFIMSGGGLSVSYKTSD